MKRILFLLILLAPSVRAQTITLGPVSKTLLCVGDSVIVPYQATGTFASDNKFFVQLSNDSGSFANFTDLNSNAAINGSISFPMNDTGAHYRVRIASSDPYVLSADNGQDINVVDVPVAYPEVKILQGRDKGTHYVSELGVSGLVGEDLQFFDGTADSLRTDQWQFDQDATPNNISADSATVTYSTIGTKTAFISSMSAAGCSGTKGITFQIASCNPVIPSTVHVVTGSETGGYPFVLVKTGGNYDETGYSDGGLQVVFVESGASFGSPQDAWGIYYLMPGSSFTEGDGDPTITLILKEGMNTSAFYGDTLQCPDLTFDYSQIPAIVAENPAPTLSLIQSGDHLFANSEETPAEIRILNILGAEVLSQHGTGALDVDLSQLPAGVYFAQVQSGDAREVRKIAVVH